MGFKNEMKILILIGSVFGAYDGCIEHLGTENRVHQRLAGYAACLERDPLTPPINLSCWRPYLQDITKCTKLESTINECSENEYSKLDCFKQLNNCVFTTIGNMLRCSNLVNSE